jgi:hypothetical protein
MSNNSATRIEKLSDPSAFESLAIAAVRHLVPELRLIAHHGINVEGKPIPGDHDARVQYTDRANRVWHGLVEVTSFSLKDLPKKWLRQEGLRLNETDGEAGDLVKCARTAAAIRRTSPRDGVQIVLVTNREPNATFLNRAYAYARRRKLSLKVITRSTLANFLDNDKDGQYIRQRYLGVQQSRLSADLLDDLSLASINQYSTFIRDAPMRPWVERAFESELELALKRARVVFIAGDSGQGKSTACLRLMRRLHAKRQPALWIPPSSMNTPARSGWDAIICHQLRELHPKLDERAGESAFMLANSVAPLVLVIDDINQISSRQELLNWIVQTVASTARAGSMPR